MLDVARKYSEILAMAEFEPELKSIYVEGDSDYYFISNFFEYINKTDIVVYTIDDVDFSEIYAGKDDDFIKKYKTNNKERVILLAQTLEKDVNNPTLPILCIVDVDWDIVLGNVRSGCFLSYTDYNSMDMYLFDYEVVEKFLLQGNRIKKIDVSTLLDTLAEAGRVLFHVHCLVNDFNESRIKNLREFKFDKETCKCFLDFDKYWEKTINKCGLKNQEGELRSLFLTRISNQCDVRVEIQGHDFVQLLHSCVNKIKNSKVMDLENFENVFWQYANHAKLANEPLFKRIAAM